MTTAVVHAGAGRRRFGLTSMPMLAIDTGLLRMVIIAHLWIVVLQIPIRAVLIDSTFVRDIGVVSVLLLSGVFVAEEFLTGRRPPRTTLHRLFVIYLLYGLATLPLAIGTGATAQMAVLQFRNHFLPAVLFFAAERAFRRQDDQSLLVGLMAGLCLVMTVDVLAEFVLRSVGVPASVFPWYRYTASISDRFIENTIGRKGYVSLETAPILGFFGWPHYTVVPLMSCFAFSYPFLIERRLRPLLGRRARWLRRTPPWVRRQAGFWVLCSVLVLAVTTHLVSAIVVLCLLPWFTNRRLLLRSLRVVLVVGLMTLALPAVRTRIASTLDHAIYTTASGPSTLAQIASPAELSYIASLPIERLMVGSLDLSSERVLAVGPFEMRLLFFTAIYGVVWLLIFVTILAHAMIKARRHITSHVLNRAERLFAIGSLGLLTVCALDMGHYARLMTAPTTDLWAVCLGALSAQELRRRERSRAAHRRWRPHSVDSTRSRTDGEMSLSHSTHQ